MIRFLDQLGKGAHVAVVRLRSLGDCVLTTPALYLLKRFRPDLRVGVVVEPRFEAVFEESPDVDDILPPSASLLLRYRPQLCLNLHGGTRSLLLTMASAARWRAGFAHYRFSRFYNVLIPRAQEILHVKRKVHTAEHVASAMFHLGVPQDEIPRARLHARPIHSSTPYAVFHALASSPLKTWPAARFLELAAFVQSRLELEPLFIGAHGDDLTPSNVFARKRSPFRRPRASSPARPCSSATTPVPPTWPPPSAFPRWFCSALPIPWSGRPGRRMPRPSSRAAACLPSPSSVSPGPPVNFV